jgi:hypothetical protein
VKIKPEGYALFITSAITLILIVYGIYRAISPPIFKNTAAPIKYIFIPETGCYEHQKPLVKIAIWSPGKKELDVKVHFKVEKREFTTRNAQRIGDSSYYITVLPPMEKGKNIFYYITAKDNKGKEIKIPKNAPQHPLFKLKFKAKVGKFALMLHVILLGAAIIFFIHTFYFANLVLFTKPYDFAITNYFKKCVSSIIWGLMLFFAGTIPVGMAIAYKAYGVAWQGFPVGFDITDNKSLVIIILWAILLLFAKKMRPKPFSVLSIICFLISAIVYCIPHSPFLQ